MIALLVCQLNVLLEPMLQKECLLACHVVKDTLVMWEPLLQLLLKMLVLKDIIAS